MTETIEVEESRQPVSLDIEYIRPVGARRWKGLLGAAAAAILLAAAVLYWLNARHYETTDDAQIDGHFALLSSRISGTVTYVNPLVENDRYVKAGTLLLELDPRDYDATLAHAKANLETREAEIRTAQLQIPITTASAYSQLNEAQAARQQAVQQVSAAQAELQVAQHREQQDEAVAARAERDRVRYQSLVEKREISRSAYDERETQATATAQALESDRAGIVAAEQKIAEMRSLVQQRDAQITAARTAPQQVQNARAQVASALGSLNETRADLQTAELSLSYTKIYAPVSGVVGHKTVELGHRVEPGQTLLTIVPVDDIWVTANFKETQLRHMRPGQPVTIHADSFDHDYQGQVEDMAGAAGPLFSLFPPENASGNYVKIVQRFPIRVRLDKGQDRQHALRPGMSVECQVRVR
jgi:membrane fusion protein (multidrug efflux system)